MAYRLLPKLKYLEKAYDSLYDLNSQSAYKYDTVLKEMENTAKEYAHKFKMNTAGTKFKLVRMTTKELKEVEE